MTDDRVRTRRPGVDTGLRTAAVWGAVDEVVRRRSAELGRPLHVLDLGGGTGGLAVPLAAAGHDVTVVDPSPDALASLSRRAAETDPPETAERITAVQGDADSLSTLLGDRRADLICCHGTLEHVEDPASTLARLAEVLADGATLSLVAAGRLAAVLSRALAGEFAEAEQLLDSPDGRWGSADPVPRRFDTPTLVSLVEGAGLRAVDVHGVRIFSDLVPAAYLDTEAERSALLALERAAASHPVFTALGDLGAAIHVLAVRG